MVVLSALEMRRVAEQNSASKSPLVRLMARILVTDDETGIREFLADALEMEGHEVDQAASGEDAIAALNQRSYALLLTDLNMPGITGMELLAWVRREQPEVEVIVLTAHGTVDNAVQAMKSGAFEFLQKPISGPEELQVHPGQSVMVPVTTTNTVSAPPSIDVLQITAF